MTSKGVRRLRVVDEQTTTAAPTDSRAPEDDEATPPTLEQLRATNQAIEVQIAALGATLVDYNNVLRNLALEVLIGLLIEHGLLDQEEFEIRKEQAVHRKLTEAFEQVKLEALARQRAEMRRQADLEVVNGPGLYVPKR